MTSSATNSTKTRTLFPEIRSSASPAATSPSSSLYPPTSPPSLSAITFPPTGKSKPAVAPIATFGERLLRIRDLIEKPETDKAPSNLAITGRYVLPPAIFDCLERTKPGAGGEIQLTDGLRLLAKEQGLWAYIFDGISYDAGDKLGFLRATVELALLNEGFGPAFRAYFKSLRL